MATMEMQAKLPGAVLQHIEGEPKRAFWADMEGDKYLMVEYVNLDGVQCLKPFRWPRGGRDGQIA